MEQTQIQTIKSISRTLKHLLVELEPANEDEWNAFDRLVAAHKQIRSIDTSKLGQMPMFAKEPETECPMCKGRGTIKDGTGQDAICAKCSGVGKVKTSILQSVLVEKENPETAQAFDELKSGSEPADSGASGVMGEASVASGPPVSEPSRRGRPRKETNIGVLIDQET